MRRSRLCSTTTPPGRSALSSDGELRSRAVTMRRRGSTLVVTIDRPSRMNALTPDVFDALLEHVPDHEAADTEAVVITGSGDKAFSAGSDLNYEGTLDGPGLARYVEL